MKNIIIVGSGWRAFFYYRVIKALPEKFNFLAMLTRSEETASRLSKEHGIKVTTSKEECIKLSPDLVVVASSKSNIAETAMEWAGLGFEVLMETPAGINEEQFSALINFPFKDKIQVAEQYHRYPRFQAMKKLLDRHIIGDLIDMYFSFCHDYHGVSMIRFFMGDLKNAKIISSVSYPFKMLETGARAGITYAGDLKEYKRNITILELEKNRHVIYDFSGVQYHTEIKSSRVSLQGSLGEMLDDRFSYAREIAKGEKLDSKEVNSKEVNSKEVKYSLSSSISSGAIGKDSLYDYSPEGKHKFSYESDNLVYHYDDNRDLVSISFKGEELWTNDYLSCGFNNDEIGIADFLSGKAKYSVDQAVEDARLANEFA